MASAYSSRVFSIVNAVYKKNAGLQLDSINLSRMMAQQLSHDLGGPWGFESNTGLLVYQDDAESFVVDWMKGDSLRFPLVKGEFTSDLNFNRVDPVDYFAVPVTNKLEPTVQAVNLSTDLIASLIVSIQARQDSMMNTLSALLGTVDTLIDILGDMKHEMAEIKDNQSQSYTAQLNFKQVTFHPVKKRLK
jgi:hypothetical protein